MSEVIDGEKNTLTQRVSQTDLTSLDLKSCKKMGAERQGQYLPLRNFHIEVSKKGSTVRIKGPEMPEIPGLNELLY